MRGNQRLTLALLPLGILFLSMLACGGFQVRVTPTPGPPKPKPTETLVAATAIASATVPPQAAVTQQPTEAPATPTPAPAANTDNTLTPGKMAKVAADLVNVRSEAKAGAGKVGSLTAGTIVTVREGPVVADNFTWYQVDNGSGIAGWVAAGPAEAPWLVPDGSAPPPTPSGPRLVDRAVKVGDLVQVTTKEGQALTVREGAGKSTTETAKVMPGTQFTVVAGPTKQDDLTWWQLEGEEVKGWAAEGDGETRWLTPVEQ